LNELKWLMKLAEAEVRKQSIWKDAFSAVEASFIYWKVFDAVVKIWDITMKENWAFYHGSMYTTC